MTLLHERTRALRFDWEFLMVLIENALTITPALELCKEPHATAEKEKPWSG